MNTYEITFEVVGSGAGMVKQVVTAASDYNARRLVEAQYHGQTVRIWNVRRVG